MDKIKSWLKYKGYSQWSDGQWNQGGHEVDIESVLLEFYEDLQTDPLMLNKFEMLEIKSVPKVF